MGKDVLGEFEHQVLLAILRIGTEAYTVSIVAELEERTGREVAPAAVYIALRRLQKKGLVTSRLGESGLEPRGRPRRYFKLQNRAIDAMRESRRTMQQLWEGVEPLLDE